MRPVLTTDHADLHLRHQDLRSRNTRGEECFKVLTLFAHLTLKDRWKSIVVSDNVSVLLNFMCLNICLILHRAIRACLMSDVDRKQSSEVNTEL